MFNTTNNSKIFITSKTQTTHKAIANGYKYPKNWPGQMIIPYQKQSYFLYYDIWNVIPHERIFINTWQKARKWLKLLGVIQTCFKFQIFWTDLIPGFNTSKFLIKPGAIIKKVSFRLSSSFPPHWKLSLQCFNMFIAFNSFVHTLLGIAFLCCKVFEFVKVGSSMYPVSRALFPVCFLSCTRHSRRLAYSKTPRIRTWVFRTC